MTDKIVAPLVAVECNPVLVEVVKNRAAQQLDALKGLKEGGRNHHQIRQAAAQLLHPLRGRFDDVILQTVKSNFLDVFTGESR